MPRLTAGIGEAQTVTGTITFANTFHCFVHELRQRSLPAFVAGLYSAVKIRLVVWDYFRASVHPSNLAQYQPSLRNCLTCFLGPSDQPTPLEVQDFMQRTLE